jgi:hypothetical protein
MTRTRDFVDSVGGFRKVTGRLGRPDTTVHGWTVGDRFPACLFYALCELADEAGAARPEPELFRFLAVPAERAAA